jgi:heparanase 1
MIVPRRLGVLAIMTLGACNGCRPDARLHVSVATDHAAATVDERFLSLAVDIAQVVGGKFWTAGVVTNGGMGAVPPFDFTRPRLLNLVRPLGHAYLRVGGTDADRTFYALDDAAPSMPPPNYEWILTHGEWDALAAFARANDFQLLFTLNFGAGPRVSHGPWLADNARELVTYAMERHDPVAVWELGNEVNAYPLLLGFVLKAADYARDLATARAMLTATAPGTKTAAPASAYWPIIGEINNLLPALLPLAQDAIDIVTWHFYPQESMRCPVSLRGATATTLLDPDNLDEIDRWADAVDSARGKIPAWLDETGNAQCGGAPGVSDTFASSLWWLDELGKLARRGVPVVARQSLSGADYGLLAEPTLSPRPDYFASLLWHQLMGARVLAATVGKHRRLRAYVHCTATGAPGFRAGSVTALFINLDGQPVTVALDGVASEESQLYRVTAPNLTALTADLNGVQFSVDSDGNPGALNSVPGEGDTVTLPPRAYAFVLLPRADAAACR